MDTLAKLNLLAEKQSQRDLLNLERQRLIDAQISEEIRARIAEIEAEFALPIEHIATEIVALEAEIKQEVISGGATVKGEHLQAVYSKPRVSWDSNLLEGLMIAIPQLERARKVGEPSVSFRKVW